MIMDHASRGRAPRQQSVAASCALRIDLAVVLAVVVLQHLPLVLVNWEPTKR
jgi:hypothetical protein